MIIMSVRKFVNRKDELERLEYHVKRDGFKFIPIYGRRRVGKTSLIKELIERNGGIYHLGIVAPREANIERLNETIAGSLDVPRFSSNSYSKTFSDLVKVGFTSGIIAIDEFPYLFVKDDRVLSEFQEIVDEILSATNITLILCGSSVSMMEEKVLSRRSPLFGRRSGQIKLDPIPSREIDGFLPGTDPLKLLEIESITGGIPRYLQEFRELGGVEKTLKRSCFMSDGYLYREVYLLLRDELREPDTYNLILEAIAGGKNKMTEIANASFIPAKDMSKYLGTLERLGFIEREHPVTDNRPKSRMTKYRLKDALFRFHFRFIAPMRGSIELSEPEVPIRKWRKERNEHISTFVEDLVSRYAVKDLGYEKAGRWWFRDSEIDCVAYDRNRNRALFSEVKWRKERTGMDTVNTLIERSKEVRELDRMDHEFLLISRSGFTRKAMEFIKENGIGYMDGETFAKSIYSR